MTFSPPLIIHQLLGNPLLQLWCRGLTRLHSLALGLGSPIHTIPNPTYLGHFSSLSIFPLLGTSDRFVVCPTHSCGLMSVVMWIGTTVWASQYIFSLDMSLGRFIFFAMKPHNFGPFSGFVKGLAIMFLVGQCLSSTSWAWCDPWWRSRNFYLLGALARIFLAIAL